MGARKGDRRKGVGTGPGRMPFVPTDAMRRLVELMVGGGMPHEDIATLVINPITQSGISTRTLHEYFKPELESGKAKANAQVLGAHMKRIQAGDTGAIIWWEKCRMKDYGWKDPSVQIDMTATIETKPEDNVAKILGDAAGVVRAKKAAQSK